MNLPTRAADQAPLPPAEIAQSDPSSAADIVRTLPGCRSQASGGEGNANISARGLPMHGGSKYVQFDEDGLPVLQFGDIDFATADQWVRSGLDNWHTKVEPGFVEVNLFIVLLLAMCSAPAISTAAPPTTITVGTHSAFTEEAPALKEATASFNRSQSAYKIDLYSSLNYRNFADWVHSTAASGTLPCLLEIDGPFLAAFAWPGYLRPLDEFVSRQFGNDLLSSIIAQGTYDGHLYSLGLYESGLGLWANRRYLAAAHVRIPTVARPWNVAEFEQAMDKLARLDGVDYPLNLAVYTGTSEFFPYAYSPILQGFGGDLIDRNTYRSEGVLDAPQSVAAMTRFQYWFKRGWTRAVFDRNDDFEQGKTALSWTGHWKYIDYRKALGNDLILLPLPNFGHGIKTGMGSYSWGITRTCADPNGAWRFLSNVRQGNPALDEHHRRAARAQVCAGAVTAVWPPRSTEDFR